MIWTGNLTTISLRCGGSAGQLLNIINDLLDFSQINAGLHRQEFDEIDVIALLYSIDRKYRPQLESRGITLNVNLCRETPALRADERALRRALEIILSNAIKIHTASRGCGAGSTFGYRRRVDYPDHGYRDWLPAGRCDDGHETLYPDRFVPDPEI